MIPALQVGDLHIGAVVTTSYGTGPYEIMAVYVSEEGVSLMCRNVGDEDWRRYDRAKWLNRYRERHGVWTSAIGDTLTVQPPGSAWQPPLLEATA